MDDDEPFVLINNMKRVALGLLYLAGCCVASEAARWADAENVAEFLGLQPPKPLALPLTLNLLFIGFQVMPCLPTDSALAQPH